MPLDQPYREQLPDMFGGQGCPGTNDPLLNFLPFDFLQPQMRKQVTQVAYGGPFVIRGNPIGAIVDAIRGFCFPVPMEQTAADGSSYAAPDGYGSYGEPSSAFPDSGYFPGFADQGGGGYVGGGMTCGTGSMWDAGQQMCVPTAGMDMLPTPAPMDSVMPCSLEDVARQAAKIPGAQIKAVRKDYADLCAISIYARQCQNSTRGPLSESWRLQADTTKAMLAASGCPNCNTCVKTPAPAGTTGMGAPAPPPPAMTPTMMPPGMGMGTPPAGGSPGTDNSGMIGGGMGGQDMQGEIPVNVTNPPQNPPPTLPPNIASTPTAGPFAYIDLADKLKMGLAQLSPQAAQNVMPTNYMPPMPQMPSPFSLTEGNIRMQPAREPLGGSFDPMRAAYGGGGGNQSRISARSSTGIQAGNSSGGGMRGTIARRGI